MFLCLGRVSSVDGNYYILINAFNDYNNSFDVSNSDFNIYTAGVIPTAGESDYTERYI